MNSVNIIGRLTKDIEVKPTSNSDVVAGFTVAINEGKTTQFISCYAFGKLAENLKQFTAKGSLIGVTGKLNIITNSNDKTTHMSVTAKWIQFLDNSKKSELNQ